MEARRAPGRVAAEGGRGGTGGSRDRRVTRSIVHVFGEVGPGVRRTGEDGTEGIEELGVGWRRGDGHFGVQVFLLHVLAGPVKACQIGALTELGWE